MAQSEALERVIVMWKDTVPLHEEPTPHHWRSEFEALCAKFPLPDDLIEEPVDADGVPALWVSAPGVSEDRVLLHFHSGGYVMGSAQGYREHLLMFGIALSVVVAVVVLLIFLVLRKLFAGAGAAPVSPRVPVDAAVDASDPAGTESEPGRP